VCWDWKRSGIWRYYHYLIYLLRFSFHIFFCFVFVPLLIIFYIFYYFFLFGKHRALHKKKHNKSMSMSLQCQIILFIICGMLRAGNCSNLYCLIEMFITRYFHGFSSFLIMSFSIHCLFFCCLLVIKKYYFLFIQDENFTTSKIIVDFRQLFHLISHPQSIHIKWD